MIRQEIQLVHDIGKRNNEQAQIFIDSSHDLLENVEAICDGQPCDEMTFIKVANSLGTMVTAFKITQQTYGDVHAKLLDVIENQTKGKNIQNPSFRAFQNLIATVTVFCNQICKILMNVYKSRQNKVKE